jgi:hypothetical protein
MLVTTVTHKQFQIAQNDITPVSTALGNVINSQCEIQEKIYVVQFSIFNKSHKNTQKYYALLVQLESKLRENNARMSTLTNVGVT